MCSRTAPFSLAWFLCSGLAAAAASEDAAAPVPSLAELLESFRALAPAASGVAVTEKSVGVGHLKLDLLEGALFALVTSRGEKLGIYFEGRGYYSYRSEDPSDQLVLAENLLRYGSGLELKQGTVRDEFDRFLMFFARPVSAAEIAGEAIALDELTRGRFEKMWRRIGLTYLEYDHLAAEARLNGGDRQYVYAEVDGRTATVGYTYDAARDYRERLWTLVKYQGADIRFVRFLSTQRLPWPVDGPSTVNLRHAKVRVATDDNRAGTIVSELQLELTQSELRVIPLRLVNNRSPNSWDWAAKKNQLRVTSVTDAEGQPVPWSHRYHEILVQLPAPSTRGETRTLRFVTEGEVFTDLGGMHADQFFELFTVTWFPQPFRWDASHFVLELEARTRKPFYPVATGESTVREDGDHFVLESRSERPVSRPALLAGKYKTKEQRVGDVTVRVHAYATASKVMTETLPGLIAELIRFYQDHLGPFPFRELDVVEIPTVLMVTAPAGVLLLPTQAYHPAIDWTAMYLARGAPAIVAHELAHQWFGHLASPAAPEEDWLSESFAEYLAALALLAGQTNERRVAGFKRMFAEWHAEAARCDEVGSLATADILGGEEGWRDRYCLLYNRGPLVLHMLRSIVGEQNFYTILRAWLAKASCGPTTTADLKKAANEVLRADVGWFLDQWWEEPGIPKIQITRSVEADGAGYALVGRVEQPAATFKKMVIPFVLEYPGGRREAKILFQERAVQEFRYALPAKPSSVTVDPAQNNLAVYR